MDKKNIKQQPHAVPVPRRIPVPASPSFVQSLSENPTLGYMIVGGLSVLLLLLIIVAVTMFDSPALSNKQSGKKPDEKSSSTSEQTEEETETKTAEEKAEQERREAEALAAAEKEGQKRREAKAKAIKEKADKEKAEQERREEEEKTAEEKRHHEKSTKLQFTKTLKLLDENFPVKPLHQNFSGDIQHPESLHPKFADLWTLKECFSLRYISYSPALCFWEKNISPHEIVISCQQHDVFRFFLDEKGLHGQWLDDPSVTLESFQKLNGIVIGELEIVQASDGQTVKTVSLLPPVEGETFRPLQKQIALPVKCDWNALGFSVQQWSISGLKCYRTKYAWKTLSPDTLQFDAGNNDLVQIKLILQPLVSGQDGEWSLPIDVREIQRDSDILERYISGTKIPPENLAAKVEEGTVATNRVRSDMLDVRRQFNRNHSRANRASQAISILSRQLSMANAVGAASISSQISQQHSILANCREAIERLGPELVKLESLYDNYYGKLKVLKEYKSLLDKPKMIYSEEPMTFTITITHPTVPEKQLTLLRIKEPDMANEKDTVIPDIVEDDEAKTDDEENEDDDDDDQESDDLGK
ncbi:MAG: hypothetical protein LBQ50_10530 [Planctomycetaceae bacterium]|jgi:hypothetical protein|nr:hypothetical protein [Planctomycetaceae bacterium]